MTDFYTIDFECYYDQTYSLAKITTQQYIMSEKFEVIGVSIAKNGGDPQWHSYDWFNPDDVVKYDEVLKKLDGAIVLAHNARFDVGILSYWFEVTPAVILDTMSMAKPLHGLTVGGSLKALADKYRIGVKGAEVIGALGKQRADMIDDGTLDAYGEYCNNDVTLCRTLYGKLIKHTNKSELKVIDKTVRMFTEPSLMLDADLLSESLTAEVAAKSELLDAAGVPRETVMSNAKLTKVLEALDVAVPTKTSPTTGATVAAMAKSDKEFVALTEHKIPLVRRLVKARLSNKSTINTTRMEKFLTLSELGPLWVPLSYCGAVGTWRWSGDDGLNMQNLPSRGENTMRRAIMAPEGHKLVVVDSSNIELRTNHTLAGEQKVIDALREGRDLYKEFAGESLYNCAVEDVTKDQRFVGKVAHLLLGYQGSWPKFQDMARQMGTFIDDDESQRIVNTWRSTYGAVPRLWRDAEKLIDSMLDGIPGELPTASFVKAKRNLLITPPHHFLQFPGLQRTMDGVTYQSRRGRGTETVYLYGGKLVENLCQHISRNILAEQFITISERYKVALMVHDEFVMVVPEDDAEEALSFGIEVMSTSPEWWPEIPLSAEGAIADRYGDAK